MTNPVFRRCFAFLLSLSLAGTSVPAYAQNWQFDAQAENQIFSEDDFQSDPLWDGDGSMLGENEWITSSEITDETDSSISYESGQIEEGISYFDSSDLLDSEDHEDLPEAVNADEVHRVTLPDNYPVPSEESTPEIGFFDSRTLVSDTSKVPYSAICKLVMEFGDSSTYVGTGFVIGPSTILTCAHCLFDEGHIWNSKNGYVTRIRVIPGCKSDSYPYGPFGYYDSAKGDVAFVKVDSNYIRASKNKPSSYDDDEITDEMCNYDCGIIRLNKNVSSKTGFLRLATTGRTAPSVHLSGYPYEARGKRGLYTQYEATGKVTQDFIKLNDFSHRTIEFTDIGSGGQSGSPLMNSAHQPFAIFNSTFEYTNRFGRYSKGNGVLIDSARLSFIQRNSDMEPVVYRVYNPNSGEHLYTTSYAELENCVKHGWKDEGLAWRSSTSTSRAPVYRLYNPNSGDHHYTANAAEYASLKKVGWRQEGVVWYAPKTAYYSRIYRLYNKYAKTGQHHFTTNAAERDSLIRAGWIYEGNPFNAR